MDVSAPLSFTYTGCMLKIPTATLLTLLSVHCSTPETGPCCHNLVCYLCRDVLRLVQCKKRSERRDQQLFFGPFTFIRLNKPSEAATAQQCHLWSGCAGKTVPLEGSQLSVFDVTVVKTRRMKKKTRMHEVKLNSSHPPSLGPSSLLVPKLPPP